MARVNFIHEVGQKYPIVGTAVTDFDRGGEACGNCDKEGAIQLRDLISHWSESLFSTKVSRSRRQHVMFLFASVLLQLVLILMLKIDLLLPIAAIYLLIGLLVAFKSPNKPNDIGAGRTIQLVYVTQFFVLSTLLTAILLLQDWADAAKFGANLFVLYFALQGIGFTCLCLKKLDYLGVVLTALFCVTLFLWHVSINEPVSKYSADHPFLIWGEQEPWWVVMSYLFWFSYVVFVTISLPKLTQQYVHIVSVVLSVFGGEFFLSRVMTASVLFLLDKYFHYTRSDFLGVEFLRMHPQYFASAWPKHHRMIGVIGCIGLAAMVGIGSIQIMDIPDTIFAYRID